MHKLVALYNQPENTDRFRKHLEEVHLPLVAKFSGLRSIRHGFGIASGAENSPYYAVVECEFDDEAAMNKALSSPEGAAAVADVPNYATAGVAILTFAVQPPLACERFERIDS
jgi:uncharacterized protein (TIGR02118 family)